MHIPLLLSTTLVSLASAQDGLVSLLQSQPDLSSLLSALNLLPDLTNALAASTNITILAPTNDAFSNIPNNTQESISITTGDTNGIAAILAYHVLNGTYASSAFTDVPLYVPTLFNSSYAINGTLRTNVMGGQNLGLVRNGDGYNVLSGDLQASEVVEADITTEATNGITIHKISTVLTIPQNLSSTANRLLQSAAAGALVQANLVSNYDTVEDLTFFVPNNEAFAAAAAALEGADVDALTAVLNYHAITGSIIFSPSITNTTVESVEGSELTFTVIDGAVFVDGARVVTPNILLSNGVAHLIDSVLNPSLSPFNRSALNASSTTTTTSTSPTQTTTSIPFTSAAPTAVSTISTPTIATTVAAVSSSYTGGAAALATARPGQIAGMVGAVLAGVVLVGA